MKKIMYFSIIIIFTAIICFGVFFIYKFNDLDNKIDIVTNSISKNSDKDLTSTSLHGIFSINRKKYLVYFYSPTCSSCTETNEIIDNFISLGYDNVLDIFYVDVSDRDDLLSDEENYETSEQDFKVAYTPTILVFDDGDVKKYVGSDEIYIVLDKYVKENS